MNNFLENKDEMYKYTLSEGLAEYLLLTVNPYCKYPNYFLFSNEEDGDACLEQKLTVSGIALKEKITKDILNFIKNEQ